MTATLTQPRPETETLILPLLGAAMRLADIEHHRDWLWEGRDLEIQDPISADLLEGDWQARAREGRELLDGFTGRVGIHGPFWSLSLMPRDPAVRDLTLRRLKTGLAFAGELGATHMVIHSPFEFFGHPAVAHTPATGLAEQLQIVGDMLGELLPVASDAGCTLVMENIRDTNPAPLLNMVRDTNHERLRVSIDVGHSFLMERIGGPTPESWIRLAGDLLGHVHLQDNDAMNDWHWPCGDGEINWRGVFAALATINSAPRLIQEVSPAKLVRSTAYLTSLSLGR
ncbi:sugar phosphate isomerase/epimerase [Deinococcus sp.]|uniref:sugar phosphate isomerase/epimerase family protein n=1 Tax=Deinococcus sp. TaxID=47478 RepID=UPI0025BF8540|nr:sugar phosphate isomerase/epimerase family protein [Deinococcus sp.]